MNNIIEQMLSKYEIKNLNDEINALKEIIQEIVLAGLSRGGFFNEAAFYGGTALRIFYKLDRFSEDLDFTPIDSNNVEIIKNILKTGNRKAIEDAIEKYTQERVKEVAISCVKELSMGVVNMLEGIFKGSGFVNSIQYPIIRNNNSGIHILT